MGVTRYGASAASAGTERGFGAGVGLVRRPPAALFTGRTTWNLYNWYYLTHLRRRQRLSSMQPITYSQARAGLADLYDQALEHLPTRIERRRADPAVLLSLEDFRTLLSQFAFAPEVLFEASSVAVWLPELAIWGRGSTFAEAKEDLLAEIDQLLALLAEDARLRSAPNMVERLPWIFRLMDAESDAEREALLFAAPATEARPLAVAGA